jgi:hypothetical protein
MMRKTWGFGLPTVKGRAFQSRSMIRGQLALQARNGQGTVSFPTGPGAIVQAMTEAT